MNLKLFLPASYVSSFAIIKSWFTQSLAFDKSINNVSTIWSDTLFLEKVYRVILSSAPFPESTDQRQKKFLKDVVID